MLSIVYITRNRAAELKKSILSCEAHVSIEHEYVIVDNGSEDGTSEMVKALAAEGMNIRYLRQEKNRGVSGGRNVGIENAYGDICYFIDDDATVTSEGLCLDEAYRYLQTHENIAALGTDCYDTERKKRLLGCKSREKGSNLIRCYVGCSHFIRKSCIGERYLYPDNLIYGAEELYAGLLFYRRGYCIEQYDKVCILHEPSKSTRTTMEERSRNGYINTYLIKKYFLPFPMRVISAFMFIVRLIRFEKGNLGKVIADVKVMVSRYDAAYKQTMTNKMAFTLIRQFGIEKIL